MFRELAEHLLKQAEASANPVFLIGAHQMMGSAFEFLGETVKSSEHLERAVALHGRSSASTACSVSTRA